MSGMEISNDINDKIRALSLLEKFYSGISDIHSLNNNVQNLLFKDKSLVGLNSYSLIDTDFFNILPSNVSFFDQSSFYTMRNNHVFYLNLEMIERTNKFSDHSIVILSRPRFENKYIIIFPCLNVIKSYESLEVMIDDYILRKIGEGYIFSGYYGENSESSLADVYFLLEDIINNNLKNVGEFLESFEHFSSNVLL